MDELFRRVQLLARLLRGVTSERANYVDPAITAMELEWDASSLLAKFLKSADVPHRTIDRAYAAGVIDDAMLSQLEERGLARWILGRLQIAPGAQMAVARKAAGQYDGENWVEPFPPEMTDALAKLVNEWDLREREPLVISSSTAESIRATHALAHPATPSIDTLVERAWFIRDDARLIVNAPDAFVGRAAALLWLELSRQAGVEALDDWFARVSKGGVLLAPSYLPSDAQSALLDEMLGRVLREGDLGDQAREWRLALADRDDLGTSSGRPPQVADPCDPVEVLKWWRTVEKMINEPSFAEMREDLSAMVSSIIRHDSLDGAYAHRARRLIQLLEAGRERCFLLRAVQRAIAFGRVEAIASLLVAPGCERLALFLLAQIPLDNDAFVGWTEEQQKRHELRVRTVWHEAASIALDVLAKLPPDDAARRIAAILLQLADEASADPLFTEERRSHANAKARLAVTLSILKDVEFGHLINNKRTRVLPKVVRSLAEALRTITLTDTIAVGKLKLLFWLLDVEGVGAKAATYVLHDWLASTKSGGWSHDHRAVAAYGWDRVARDVDASGFDTLIATKIGGSSDDNQWAAMNRERLLLRVLSKAHAGLIGRAFPTAEQIRRREALEAALGAHLAGSASKKKFGSDNPLNRLMEGTRIGANIEDLTAVVARAVDQFMPATREKAISDWLGQTEDAILLIRAALAMRSTPARKQVLARFFELDLSRVLHDETPVSVAGMAEDAIGLRERSLAEKMLSLGDALFTDKREEQWRQEALKPQLALAALLGDQAKFDALVAGSTDAHEFQRGVLALHTDKPDEAVALFERLAEANPHSPGAQVNLFASRIRSAQLLDASRKEEHIEKAIDQWIAARAQLQPEDRERAEPAAVFNMLLAYGELGRHTKFEDALRELTPSVRFSPDIVGLAVEVFKERGAIEKAATFLMEAEAVHGKVDWIDQLRRKLSDGLPVAKPEVQVAATDRALTARELRNGINEAVRRSPDEVAIIFGEPDDNVEELLHRIHLEVAEEMLLLKVILERLRDEDKFNQIFVKILKGRLERLGWTVGEGSPGGTSDGAGATKGTAGGEGWRDWIIQARGRELCVCEALRCLDSVSKEYVTTHVNKLAKYDPVGRPFAFVVAYLELLNFDAAAEKYHSIVASATLQDLPLLRCDPKVSGSPGLKTFRSVHTRGDGEVTVHHILIKLASARGR